MLTRERARQIFSYDNGHLVWLEGKRKGQRVGTVNTYGYLCCQVDYRKYLVHRVVFFMHFGWWPPVVDHVNGDPLDNRIENLRSATQRQNCYNSRTPSNNTSGIKNVRFDKRRGTWGVSVRAGGVRLHIGTFRDRNAAADAASEAMHRLHGEFARV